jgi:putative ABC transport system permease protein
MLKNYIKIAFRNMKRHKGFSFINIFGLAIGLSCSFLIFLYVFDELSYDRFHQDADRIYRIISDFKSKDTEDRGLLTSYILAKTLRENYPEKFQVTQIKLRGSIVTINSKSFGNERIIGADNSFFNMFTYQFIIGNPKTVLNSPNEAIITDEAAIKYFGNFEAIGQTIQIDGNAYQITGIIKNNHQNSHFYFDVLFSLKSLSNYGDTRYLYNYYSTYVKLPLSVPVSRLRNILSEYSEKNFTPLFANEGISISLSCEPLLGIHLHSGLNGPYGANSKIEYVYIFSVIAFLILVIACINYVNLTTAKNLNRAREVGIRKVVGSISGQINRQFLLESVIFCWISVGISLILVKIYLPFFNILIGKSLQLNYLSNPLIIIGFIMFATIIGVMAGIYPALYLSSFNPIEALKDRGHGGQKKFRLQSSLVVFQFTISVIFMISTLVINKQLVLVQKKNLGFNKEQMIVLQWGWALGKQKEVFKNNLLKYPTIINVSGTSSLPGRDFSSWSITPEDVESNSLALYFCDSNFAETMGIDIQKGRFFSKKFSTDSRAIVINERTAEQFGWTDNPIGKKIQLNVHGDYTVIGVVENFHYETLHSKLGNMGMILTQGRYYGNEKYLAIKYSSQNIADVINTVKKEWNSIIPNAPFEYSFLDEDYYRLYKSEQQMQKISLLFSFLAILISALGIFGLASFSVDKRKKEIGVRKILGASVVGVELLLCKEFMKWVLLANIVACPIAYVSLNKWLNDFAYRASLSAELFIIPGTMAFIIALIAVSIKVIRAAVANPAEALRCE